MSATCKPRKIQACYLCGQKIDKGELCERWSGVTPGDGWWTSHAHPECYAATSEWNYDDWECHGFGDMERPNSLQRK